MKLPRCIRLRDRPSLCLLRTVDQATVELRPGVFEIVRSGQFKDAQSFAKAVVRLAVRGTARCNRKEWTESITEMCRFEAN